MSSFFGLVPILAMTAIQLLLIRNVSSLNLTNAYLHHKCNNTQGKYKPGSAFEKSLNTVRRYVESTRDNFHTGFFYPRQGEEPNTPYLIYQCRGDSYGSTCRSCVSTAISELLKRCSGNKGAIIWYDQCLCAITSVYSYNKVDYENIFYMSNANNVSGDPKLFNKNVLTHLENLQLKAAIEYEEGDKSYAAGEKRIGTEKMYAMVQCTKDLVANKCYACLHRILEKFPECCDGKRGGRILGTNCNFRYEFYPFLRH